ncbi:hypothetical protein QUA56_35875 [Microcoleus sp. N3A4]|uniref:hypothetical protein n=1 Tax=Microcoleus sp. N3A4 TaxID=3055379 RepID=UPI002FD71C46
MKAAKLEIGVLRKEAARKEAARKEAARKEEEGRSQKKCFYKYEMLPVGGDRGECALQLKILLFCLLLQDRKA